MKINLSCNQTSKNRLLEILDDFNTKRYYVEKIAPDKYHISVLFIREIRKLYKNKFHVGAGANYSMMTDKTYKEVYSSGGFSSLFNLSYVFSGKIELLI